MVPTISSSMFIGARGVCSSRASVCATQAWPAAMVLRVPPVSWITSSFAGRPDARIVSSSLPLLKPSQPSETSSTAPTFGWVHRRSIILYE